MKALSPLLLAITFFVASCGDSPTPTASAPLQAQEELRSRPCCRALIATCLACVADQSVEEYCQENPDTIGCPEDSSDSDRYNCRTRERWSNAKRAWCCENEGLGCISYGDDCTTTGTRGFPPVPCEEDLFCDIYDDGYPEVDIPDAGTCEESATCEIPYTLCKNRRQCARKLGGSKRDWRCVEKKRCKPGRCGFDANCDTTWCTRDCRRPRRGRFGHCIPR